MNHLATFKCLLVSAEAINDRDTALVVITKFIWIFNIPDEEAEKRTRFKLKGLADVEKGRKQCNGALIDARVRGCRAKIKEKIPHKSFMMNVKESVSVAIKKTLATSTFCEEFLHDTFWSNIFTRKEFVSKFTFFFCFRAQDSFTSITMVGIEPPWPAHKDEENGDANKSSKIS